MTGLLFLGLPTEPLRTSSIQWRNWSFVPGGTKLSWRGH